MQMKDRSDIVIALLVLTYDLFVIGFAEEGQHDSVAAE